MSYPLPPPSSGPLTEFKVELKLTLSESQAELVWPLLFEAPMLGAQLCDDTTVPPGPGGGLVAICAHFEAAAAAMELRAQVLALAPDARAEVGFRYYRDVAAYFAQFQPIQTKRLWVGPPWLLEQAPKRLRAVIIGPQDVFGSRGHPTTAMLLEYLESHRPLKGASVFDVGTGTGVLAVAAKLLGSGETWGNDIDAAAVASARRLAKSNRVALRVSTTDVARVKRQFDVVLANIPTTVWPTLAQPVARIAQRDLFISGYPVERAAEHEALFAPLRVVSRKTKGLWAAAHLRRAA